MGNVIKAIILYFSITQEGLVMSSFRSMFFFLILAGCLLSSGVTWASTEPLPPDSWFLPFDVNVRDNPPISLPDSNPPLPVFTQQEIYEFMWQSFIALNWPHKNGGSRGEPDTQKSSLLGVTNSNPTGL